MSNAVVSHDACRLCGGKKLRKMFSLGEQFINDFVDKEYVNKGIKAPLELVICDDCTLLQLKHTAPQQLLYTRHYWYRSGVTDTMKNALREITNEIKSQIHLQPGDVVLDIGANDGTLIDSYEISGLVKVGCEPANNLIPLLKDKTEFVMHDFWSHSGYMNLAKKWGVGKAKVITAIGMFYDLEDPNSFIWDIKKSLDEDGIFVAQLMCLASMLIKNDLGNICHEHIEYYSYNSLKYMFEKNGLEIFKVTENNVNGGSYRIYARHFKNGSIEYPEACNEVDIMNFFHRIEENKQACISFIKEEVSKGKKVYVYGASTKGNVILQYYGLDSTLITAAAERSPEKWGKFTIGSGIPIVSEEAARIAQPDYFLVLPWAFFDEFYVREEQWRLKGGKFIVPLPEFRVVE